MGVDSEGPSLIFTNSTGVKENINITQGSQSWEITSKPTEESPFLVKSVSDDKVVFSGRIIDQSSGASRIKFEVCHSSMDCSDANNWIVTNDIQASEGAQLDQWSFELSSSFDPSSSEDLKSGVNSIKIIAFDLSGNTTTSYLNFIIDNIPPVITSIQFINSDDQIISNTFQRNVNVKIVAEDGQTNIEKICVKLEGSNPDVSNSCWQILDEPKGDIINNSSINLGFFPKSYPLYSWVVDEVGNISEVSSAEIYFTPKDKPQVLEILA